MNAKLAAIAAEAAENLKDLVRNSEEKILEAWHAAEAEASDNETSAKFRMGLTLTLDLDKDRMETALSFGVRFKASRDQQIPEPAQTSLEFEAQGAKSLTVYDHGKPLKFATPKEAAEHIVSSASKAFSK